MSPDGKNKGILFGDLFNIYNSISNKVIIDSSNIKEMIIYHQRCLHRAISHMHLLFSYLFIENIHRVLSSRFLWIALCLPKNRNINCLSIVHCFLQCLQLQVVGLLIRARKYKLVSFEGETLFQGTNDKTPIYLLRYFIWSYTDCWAFDILFKF